MNNTTALFQLGWYQERMHMVREIFYPYEPLITQWDFNPVSTNCYNGICGV